MNKKRFKKQLFLIVVLLLIFMLVGCELNLTTKRIRVIIVVYNDIEEEIEEGTVYQLSSTNDNFVAWEINHKVVSLSKDYQFTVTDTTGIKEITQNDLETPIENKVYFYLRDSELTEMNVVCNVYVPNGLPIMEYGFVYSSVVENELENITEWNDIVQYTATEMTNSNEFNAKLKKAKVVKAFVVTNNGTEEQPIKVYHYSDALVCD